MYNIKGNTLIGYKKTRERAYVRIEDILYFETVDGRGICIYCGQCL